MENFSTGLFIVLLVIIITTFNTLHVNSSHRTARSLGDIIGGLLPTTTGNPTTTQSLIQELSCSQPLVDGLACTATCGVGGGGCNLGTCWCNCKSIVKNITAGGLGVIGLGEGSTCVESNNATSNAECNAYCNQSNRVGSMCSVVGMAGAPSSDICTCRCNASTLVVDSNNPITEICSIEGVNSAICQLFCGPLGGTCDAGTCYCKCPPSGSPPISDDFRTTSCPAALQIHRNDSFKSSCDAVCGFGSTNSEVCSITPPNTSLLMGIPILGPLLVYIYELLVEQTKLCVCRYC